MSRPKAISPVLAFSLTLGACASTPETAFEREELVNAARMAVQDMERQDATLRPILNDSAGYAVYPGVGEAAFIAGATMGEGVVFEKGEVVGFSNLNAGSVGAQVGGQTFDQLVIFKTSDALERLKLGNFSFSADIGATAVASGASARATFQDGVAVLIEGEKGVMAKLSIGGQQLDFEPRR